MHANTLCTSTCDCVYHFLPPVQPVQFNTLQSNELYPQDYPDNGGRGDEEPFQHLEVHLVRQVSGFGFRIIGGREEGSQVTIGGIVQGGAADVDGRLQVTLPHKTTPI